MTTNVKDNPAGLTMAKSDASETPDERVLKFKKRMLEWNNPVEFVNNMYGSHPDDGNNDYFKTVYSK